MSQKSLSSTLYLAFPRCEECRYNKTSQLLNEAEFVIGPDGRVRGHRARQAGATYKYRVSNFMRKTMRNKDTR